jgi:hypothetical protein
VNGTPWRARQRPAAIPETPAPTIPTDTSGGVPLTFVRLSRKVNTSYPLTLDRVPELVMQVRGSRREPHHAPCTPEPPGRRGRQLSGAPGELTQAAGATSTGWRLQIEHYVVARL